MKSLLPILLASASPFFAATLAAAPASAGNATPGQTEAHRAIEKGLAWLKAHQNADGSWSVPEQPGLTALPLLAFLREPNTTAKTPRPECVGKALDYIRSTAKPDGSMWVKGISNYNTSVCLTALIANADPKDEARIGQARQFIIGLQAKNMADESLDGGIGYGPTAVSPSRQFPDLDNTLIALEALRTYNDAHPQVEKAHESDLNWKAAIDFVTRCQNLPGTNSKASTDPADHGGFVYYPGYSNAGSAEEGDPSAPTAP